MSTRKKQQRGIYAIPVKKLNIKLLAICFILFSFPGMGQQVYFEIDSQGVDVGELLTITNQSESIEEGYFSFCFEFCGFYQTNLEQASIVCTVTTSDHNAVIEGFFWQSGTYTITLYGINKEGDTLESPYFVQVEVSPFFTTTPIDSCPDTSAYNCNNLVCNGSFEWISNSLTMLGQLTYAYPWRDAHSESTCDLLNPNNSGPFNYFVDVPNNFFGTQHAQHGAGYCGLGGFIDQSNDATFELGTSKLKAPMKMGQRYAVEYYTSMADTMAFACNGAKVYFSSSEPHTSSWQTFYNQINPNHLLDALGNFVITDKQNWTHFYDVFIPDSNTLEWISIGLMREWQDMTTGFDPNVNSPFGNDLHFYYYYDNISVTPLPPLVYLEHDTVSIYRCQSAELLVLGEGTGSYKWSNNATTQGITVSPMTNTSYSVTVWDPEECHAVILQAYVIIKDPDLELPIILGHNNDCDTITSYNLENRQSSYTYIWEISSNHGVFTANNTQTLYQVDTLPVEIEWKNVPALPSYATLSVTEVTVCDEPGRTVTYKVFRCCTLPESFNYLNNDTISDTTFIASNDPYMINGELVINAQQLVAWDIGNPHIKMGPMARIKVISPNTELRLDSCHISNGCGYMWDGIYLNDSSQLLIANESYFTDGINVVMAENGPKLDINSCRFNSNYQAINYDNFHESDRPSVLSSGKYWPVDIVGSAFWSSLVLPLQLPPMTGFFPRSAIEIRNSDTITIGRPGAIPNYFHDLPQAIIVKNSNTGIFNNTFADIGIESETYPPEGAVDIMRTGSSPVPWIEVRIGNGTTAGVNSFERCWHPITMYQNPVIIHRNDFLDCEYGIHGLDVRNQTRIMANQFTQSSTTSLTGETAIILKNVTLSPKTLTLLVDSNNIQGYQKGIWTTNVDKQTLGTVRYSYNDIYFNVLGYPVSGIKIDNGTGSLISDNLIRSVSRPDSTMGIGRHNGIWTNYSLGALITHNQLLRMGNGIYTTGPGLNTFFVCNALDSCYFGLYFGESTSLSHQGVFDEYNTANHWLGDYSSNGCSYWRRMMQVPYNITNPVINWYYHNTYTLYDPGTNHCMQNHPLFLYVEEIENNDAQTDCPIITLTYDAFDISTIEEREFFLGSIARSEIIYNYLQEPYREIEGDFFFRIANNNPQILSFGDTSDAAYQQYYQHLSQRKTGLKDSVYQHINKGDYLQAYYMNESLPDTTPRDALRKNVNRIYLDSWCQQVFDFNPADRDSLISYAYGNPYAMGDGVFSARVLLGLDPDKVPLTQSAVVENKHSTTEQILFYPNPGKDKVCFIGDTEQVESGSLLAFELFDSFGKKVVDTAVANRHGEICVQLPGNISPGLYIVRIGEQSGNKVTGKIIIR